MKIPVNLERPQEEIKKEGSDEKSDWRTRINVGEDEDDSPPIYQAPHYQEEEEHETSNKGEFF